MCSSTPRTCTPSKLEGSPAAWVGTGWTWDQSVFQVVPSCQARPWIVARSTWSWPIAHLAADYLDKNLSTPGTPRP